MKNKNYIFLFTFLFYSNAFAENIQIQAKNITLDKDKVTTVFENDVVVKTRNKIIKSQYVKYNKKIGLLILKNDITATDSDRNTITTENAEFDENEEIFKTFGPTNIVTSEKYIVVGRDIIINNKNKTISSNLKAQAKEYSLEIKNLKDNHALAVNDLISENERIKNMQSKRSTKMVGTSLEQHVEIEFETVRADAYRNAIFKKDTKYFFTLFLR